MGKSSVVREASVEHLPKLAYSVAEVVQMVGISRTTVFKLIKEHQLDVVKVGGRTLVLADDLNRWLSGLKG
jgi:excisionase family DNA binding protein